MAKKTNRLFSIVLLLYCGTVSAQFSSVQNPAEKYLECGEPIVKAGVNSLGLPFPRRNPAYPPAAILPSSRARLEEIRAALGELSPEEELIAAEVGRFSVPIAHRTRLQRLKSIFASGGLLSPREASIRGLDLVTFAQAQRGIFQSAHKGTNPGLSAGDILEGQNLLEGSYDCVFAAIGNPGGKDSYGEVIISIKAAGTMPRMLTGLRSAAVFLQTAPRAASGAFPSEENILAYSRTVYSGELTRELLGLLIITNLRAATGTGGTLLRDLAKAGNTDSFYSLATKLIYLEAKIPKTVPFEDIELVEVPKKYLAEVLGWEEAKPWREKIKGY